jgi:signal transduction histidine kinase
MRSLRSRLFLLWLLSLAASLAVGSLLVGLYRQSSLAQFARADAAASQACDAINDRYGFYAAGWAGPAETGDASFRSDLGTVVSLALAPFPDLAGGIWEQDSGSLAATIPLTGVLTTAIGGLAGEIAADGLAAGTRVQTEGTTLVMQACALRGPVPGLSAWAMARLPATPGADKARMGLGVLLALALGMTGLLTWTVLAWRHRIAAIEAALSAHAAGTLRLAPTGERELDRIVAALNLAGERLAQAQARSDALAARVAVSERLAALGRVAAGMAHEIRNPIAAMRLRAENALAGDDARRRTALAAILAQIARLDHLIAELLAMTQRSEPKTAPVDVRALLEACAAEHRDGRVAVVVEAAAMTLELDAAVMRRVLDNLVQNAIRHSPDGGVVTLRAEHDGTTLRIRVADTGEGVPGELRSTLFEPFVTGRPDGTGLGLAIARELVRSHGGQLELTDPGPGAVFTIAIPVGAIPVGVGVACPSS